MNTFNNYEDMRNSIESGDIVFVRGSKKGFRLIQRLIMWATGSVYTHVGVAFWVQIDGGDAPRLMIVESQGGSKRRILNLSFYQKDDLDIVPPPKKWSDISILALERIGQVNYGYFDALWVGIRERLQIAFNWNLPRFNFNGETCSEFVARLFKLNTTVVSPQTLFEELSKLGFTVKTKLKHK